MTHDHDPRTPDSGTTTTGSSHDALGAYLLGALPEPERTEFEAHLRECQQCQDELHALGPIAALLPRLYDDLDLNPPIIEPDTPTEAPERAVGDPSAADSESTTTTEESPTAETVDRESEKTASAPELLQSPTSPSPEAVAEEADEQTVESQPVTEPTPSTDATTVPTETPLSGPIATSRRPHGRITPGEAPEGAEVIALPRDRRSVLPWIIAGISLALAIGMFLWALAMLGQIGDLKDERDLQDQQIAQMSQEREQYLRQTAATVHSLVPTTAGTTDATAMVYLDPDPDGWGGIVVFRGMPAPSSGDVYQLWTIVGGQVSPGPTFVPGANGQAIVQIDGSAAATEQMAITQEPSGGSETPTTAPVMQGDLTV